MDAACKSNDMIDRASTAGKMENSNVRSQTTPGTWDIENNVRQLISGLQVTVFLDEPREREVDVILVGVRVLRGALQFLDGLGADLVVLLWERGKYYIIQKDKNV